MQHDRPNFGARILVAEDNAVNQEVAGGILENLGCRTVSAPNGRAAVKLFAQEKFDLILMDCEMPVMDGIEATGRIRQIEAMAQALPDGSAAPRTPIVALTAHALVEVREKCLASGMDDFLVKPFDERQMAATLMRWLTPIGMFAPGPAPAPVASPIAALRPAQQAASASTVIDPVVIDSLRMLDRNNGSSRLARAVSRFVEVVAPPLVEAILQSCEKRRRRRRRCGARHTVWKSSSRGARRRSARPTLQGQD